MPATSNASTGLSASGNGSDGILPPKSITTVVDYKAADAAKTVQSFIVVHMEGAWHIWLLLSLSQLVTLSMDVINTKATKKSELRIASSTYFGALPRHGPASMSITLGGANTGIHSVDAIFDCGSAKKNVTVEKLTDIIDKKGLSKPAFGEKGGEDLNWAISVVDELETSELIAPGNTQLVIEYIQHRSKELAQRPQGPQIFIPATFEPKSFKNVSSSAAARLKTRVSKAELALG